MKTSLTLLALLISFQQAFASEAYVRKLSDARDGSSLFLACQSEQQCQVLGGGSISSLENQALVGRLQRQQILMDGVFVVSMTGLAVLNPAAIMSFLTIPAGIITFAGSTAYMYLNREDSKQYKIVQLLKTESSKEISNQDVIEALDQELLRLRSQR